MDDGTTLTLTPSQIAGAVISGGKSTRMGQDKALLRIGGKTLLDHAAQKLAAVCNSTMILSNHASHDLPGLPRYPDRFEDIGPLGGLLTAFAHLESDYLLVLAVDMPLVPIELLGWLTQLVPNDAAAVIPQIGDRVQPLCGLYARKALPYLTQAHASRKYGLTRMLSTMPVAYVQPDSSQDFYFPEIFYNVNHPEDWQFIQKKLRDED